MDVEEEVEKGHVARLYGEDSLYRQGEQVAHVPG